MRTEANLLREVGNTVSKLKSVNNMTDDSLIDARSVTAKKDNLPTYQTFLALNSRNKGIIKRFFLYTGPICVEKNKLSELSRITVFNHLSRYYPSVTFHLTLAKRKEEHEYYGKPDVKELDLLFYYTFYDSLR